MSDVRWSGLDELKAALRNLPPELRAEAAHICEATANAARVSVADGYQKGLRNPGELVDKLEVTRQETGSFGVSFTLINRSKLANIFENGTQVRRTAKGANRGQIQPPLHVFIPTVARKRREMYQELADLLTRKGLTVSGDVR